MKQKQIVFLEYYSTVMLYKMAKEFRKRGYETILIRMLKPDDYEKQFYDSAYNKVIDFNISKINSKNYFFKILNYLKNLINFILNFFKLFLLKPAIIIGRSNPNLMVAFFRIFSKLYFKKTIFIYFPYDIRCQYAPTIEIAKRDRGFSIFEIKAERFCFENCHGIIHKGAPEELNYLNKRMLGDNLKLPKYQLTFHPYCSKEFMIPLNKKKLSKKDNQIHCVYIGTIGMKTSDFYLEVFESFKKLINEKIHAHLYLTSNILDKENNIEDTFKEKFKQLKGIDYFHIHKSLDPKEIVKEISKYDFGISLAPPLRTVKYKPYDLEPNFMMANKIATYLEASIPFISSRKFIFLNKLLNSYSILITYPEDMKDFKKMIKKIDYKKLEKNLLKAREDFSMENNFLRLEEFIKQIKNSLKTY